MKRCTIVLLSCLIASRANTQISVTLQGQWGGESRVVALAKDGAIAYLGVGPRVVLLDVSNPDDMRELGKSEVLLSVVEDIVVEGDYAFVATGRGGLYVLDVSDAAAPKVVGHGEVPSQPAYMRGLHVCLTGKHVYFADGQAGLRIFDVSNPARPACVAELSDIRVYDVAVADGRAYVASSCDGLVVFDVSDPVHPQAIAHLDIPACANEIELSDGYAYLAGTRIAFETQAGLYVVDVRNPAKPAVVGRCELENPGGLALAGKIAYVANGSKGVEFVRITNPALPARVGAYAAEGLTRAVAATGGRIYIIGAYAGLEVVDVSHLAKPVSQGWYGTAPVKDVAVSGDYAYVASVYAGMQVIDVSDPNAPALASWLDLDYVDCIALAQGRICVGDGLWFKLINVSNPLEPQVVSECLADGAIDDIAVEGAYAYAATSTGLSVLDISNPQIPFVASRHGLPTSARGICVSDGKAYLVGLEGLHIIDISNPTNPLPMGQYSEGIWPAGIAIHGDYAYQAGGNAGLGVIDVSDPWLPGRVGRFAALDAQGIAIEGKYGYLGDSRQGLQILDVSNPGAPVRLGGYVRAGFDRIVVSGGSIYTADSSNGLAILKMHAPSNPEPDQDANNSGL